MPMLVALISHGSSITRAWSFAILSPPKKVLHYFLDKALHRRSPFQRLHFVIHLLEAQEGGLTDVEKSALIGLARDLGAKGVVLCTGADEMSEAAVRDLTRPIRGKEFYEAT